MNVKIKQNHNHSKMFYPLGRKLWRPTSPQESFANDDTVE